MALTGSRKTLTANGFGIACSRAAAKMAAFGAAIPASSAMLERGSLKQTGGRAYKPGLR